MDVKARLINYYKNNSFIQKYIRGMDSATNEIVLAYNNLSKNISIDDLEKMNSETDVISFLNDNTFLRDEKPIEEPVIDMVEPKVISNELDRETLNDIKKGNINKEEIDNSKEYILSSLYKNEDNIYSIVNDMITNVLFNKIDRETYKEEIKKIKKQDLITLANKLELDVVYLLRGI